MRNLHLAGFALTSWLVGLLALVCDSVQSAPYLITATRGLFIVVTCAALCLVLVPRALAAPSASSIELYLFTRFVSRWTYIALYGLALVRLTLYLSVPDHARSMEDFQFYIAWTVIPLWVIRAVILAIPSVCLLGQQRTG